MAGHSDLRRTSSSNSSKKTHVVDIIELIHTPPYKDKNFLQQKYAVEGRSIAQIAREIFSSRAAVRSALIKFGIKRRQRGKPGKRPAQVPYGYRRSDGLLVQHEGEQKVLSVIAKMHRKGTSLREICDFLTSIGVPTKCKGLRWHTEMVRRIIQRSHRMSFDSSF